MAKKPPEKNVEAGAVTDLDTARKQKTKDDKARKKAKDDKAREELKKEQRSNEMGVSEVKTRLKVIVDGINGIDTERRQLNAQAEVFRSQAEEMGINRHALARAIQYAKMTEAQQQGFDFSYSIARDAVGTPIQAALPLGDTPIKKD